jgi:hypothetical protein
VCCCWFILQNISGELECHEETTGNVFKNMFTMKGKGEVGRGCKTEYLTMFITQLYIDLHCSVLQGVQIYFDMVLGNYLLSGRKRRFYNFVNATVSWSPVSV